MVFLFRHSGFVEKRFLFLSFRFYFLEMARGVDYRRVLSLYVWRRGNLISLLPSCRREYLDLAVRRPPPADLMLVARSWPGKFTWWPSIPPWLLSDSKYSNWPRHESPKLGSRS